MKKLNDRERKVLKESRSAPFGGERTDAEIAKELRISEQRVQSIRQQAFRKIMEDKVVAELRGRATRGVRYQDSTGEWVVPLIPRPENVEPLSREDQAEVERQRTAIIAQYQGTDQWLKAPNGEVSNLVQAAKDLGLSEEYLWVTVRTPYFKAWFGDWEKAGRPAPGQTSEDSAPFTSRPPSPASAVATGDIEYSADDTTSQVVDENGEPLLIFHGTQAMPRFQRFQHHFSNIKGAPDPGFHFGNRDQAENRVSDVQENEYGEEYRSPRENAGVLFGFLNMRSPLTLEVDFGRWDGNRMAWAFLNGEDGEYLPFALTSRDRDDLRAISQRGLRDGTLAMREWLESHGFDGITYENDAEGPGASYMVLHSNQFKAADNLGTFGSGEMNFYRQDSTDKIVRGAYTPLTKTVHLFEKADGSTFAHETYHYMMDLLSDMQSQGLLAGTQYEEDLRKLREYSTVDGKYDEERGAKAWEKYLMEGVAPEGSGLQKLFDYFKAVLTQVYRNFKNYFVGIDLDPEVKAIFDSWLSSEVEAEEQLGINPVLQMLLHYRPDENGDAEEVAAEQGMNNTTRGVVGRAVRALLESVKSQIEKGKAQSRREYLRSVRETAERLADDMPVYILEKLAGERGAVPLPSAVLPEAHFHRSRRFARISVLYIKFCKNKKVMVY